MNPARLLYLGFAFPPGLQALHPDLNPAGHAFETQMLGALRPHFDLRTVGVLGVPWTRPPAGADPASGVAHELVLQDRAPELWHRPVSLWRLRRQYRRWCREGWRPDVVLVYNLTPIYGPFLKWLGRQMGRPRRVLLLSDSAQLGCPMPAFKRLRYQLKPFAVLEDRLLTECDGCIGLSRNAARHFASRSAPFLWMPGGCTPARAGCAADPETASTPAGPIRFGYFGALAAHAGLGQLLEAFTRTTVPATLEVCGYGKMADAVASASRRDPRIRFHGLLPSPEDCLRFGRSCDVLVNPRPEVTANENNFPSKIFEYALCGRAIVTTRLAGIEDVLGPDAFYGRVEDTEVGRETSAEHESGKASLPPSRRPFQPDPARQEPRPTGLMLDESNAAKGLGPDGNHEPTSPRTWPSAPRGTTGPDLPLTDVLVQVAGMSRAELHRRGAALRHRIVTEYSWERQAARMAEFIRSLVKTACK